MVNKVQKRPKGGAHHLGAASTIFGARCRDNVISALICFTCGVCFILSLTCTCLVTLVVLLDQTAEAASYDFDRVEAFTAMMKNSTDPGESFRLPKEVKPVHYDLFLYPDLDKGKFSGKVTILLDVLDKRKTIALHQKNLNITSVTLKSHGLAEDFGINISSTSESTKNEMFVVSTENEFNPGLYDLYLEFNGSLENKIIGFYSSKYQQADNKTHRLIATSKFEPTYARQAFPCFDEPNFKAEFMIQLVHPTGNCYSALSNMNVKQTVVDQPAYGLTTVQFAKSVPMSTYLACFIVSDFVAVTKMAKGLNNREFPVSVYTTRLQPDEKKYFALDVGVKAIEYYINLYQIDYPLPKLDMAAIPDFVSGAMENWGIVTYRETRLLYDNRTNSISDRYNVAITVCHELAHMWFGNLVTLSWWNDLWLNEGFATFMSYKSANEILPNQKFMEKFLVDVVYLALIADARLSSHPIVHDVKNPDEITSAFDEISYKKGASIIRMMENFIGPDVFYGAISTYLNKYAYGNAETADFFNVLQDAVGDKLNVTATMDTWLRQEGYPVINITRSGNKFVLHQKRFLADVDAEFDPSKSDYGYKWTVPITYITNKKKQPTLVWFDKNASEVLIDVDQDTEWIKLNVDQVGYYRVNYNIDGWKTFQDLLRSQHMNFSIADRANLLSDVFNLAEAGELDYNVAMNISLYLTEEYHAIPWIVASSKLKTINTLLSSANQTNMISSLFQAFARKLVRTIYHDVTWTVDDTLEYENDTSPTVVDNKVRRTVLDFACAMNYTDCLQQAGQLLKNWLNDPRDIRPHPDIRSIVYYYGMRHVSDEADWHLMFDLFKRETDPSERNELMKGLAGIRSTAILKDFITKATDTEYVRSQDFLNCLISISGNPDGTLLVWDWVRENWEFLVDRYTLNDRYLGNLMPAITRSFATQTKLDEMKAFFEKYPEVGAGAYSRAKALETVSKNIKWVARNAEKLENWLVSHKEDN